MLHFEPRARLLHRPARLPANGSARAAYAGSFDVPVTPNNTFFLQLDMAGASNAPGDGLIDWWDNGNANQGWYFKEVYYSGSNDYAIINDNSRLCLTSDGIAGDQVYQEPCGASYFDGSSYFGGQIWYTGLSPSSNDAWSIENVDSGLSLDVNGDNPFPGASIDTWPFWGGANQYFAID
jgi:hypothetical protein